MRRMVTVLGTLVLAMSASAFSDTIDPVGFCPIPASVSSCTTSTGVTGETISINSNSQFGMYKNGNGGSAANPWFLLLAVPEPVGGGVAAPSITNTDNIFMQQGPVTDEGKFFPNSPGSIYNFVNQPQDDLIAANQSMNASNLFSQNEISARGSLPSYFEIFAYSFSPSISNNTAYAFSSSGLVAGTYLAAAGGTQPFSTPYTVTGLITSRTPPATVPEPGSMLLFGTGLSGVAFWMRRRSHRQKS